jgi:hypothetical protein
MSLSCGTVFHPPHRALETLHLYRSELQLRFKSSLQNKIENRLLVGYQALCLHCVAPQPACVEPHPGRRPNWPHLSGKRSSSHGQIQ